MDNIRVGRLWDAEWDGRDDAYKIEAVRRTLLEIVDELREMKSQLPSN